MIEVAKVYPEKPLSYEDIKKFISEISNDRLITICNEIYDWKNGNDGVYHGVELAELSKELGIQFYIDVENYVIPEAVIRFRKMALLMFEDRPSYFLKTVK